METTIQVSKELAERLRGLKMHNKESYEELIWDLIEDRMELSDETMKNIKESEEDIKAGRVYGLEEVKERFNKRCGR
jgi:predicted transcriptional regulator